MDVLEDESYRIVAIPFLVHNLHLSRAVVTPRDVEFLHLLASEGINTILDPVVHLVDLESHNLTHKLIIRVSLWLSVQID